MPIIVLNFEIKVKIFTTKLQCAVVKVKYKVSELKHNGFNARSKNRTATAINGIENETETPKFWHGSSE